MLSTDLYDVIVEQYQRDVDAQRAEYLADMTEVMAGVLGYGEDDSGIRSIVCLVAGIIAGERKRIGTSKLANSVLRSVSE